MTGLGERRQFGERLRGARLRAKLTIKQAAEELEVSDRAVQRWENGEYEPQVAMLGRLARLYGTTVDKLVRDPNEAAA